MEKKRINVRTMGHNAERYYAKLFRELGYTFCKTSRLASKLLDDSKIDLAFLPFNIQIKAGAQKGLNPTRELKLMADTCIENFPPTDSVHAQPKLVVHKKTVLPKGRKADEFDQIVTMTFEDFIKILKHIPPNE